MARMAGRDMTASPSQLVARTRTRDIEDGLKATSFRIAAALQPLPVERQLVDPVEAAIQQQKLRRVDLPHVDRERVAPRAQADEVRKAVYRPLTIRQQRSSPWA